MRRPVLILVLLLGLPAALGAQTQQGSWSNLDRLKAGSMLSSQPKASSMLPSKVRQTPRARIADRLEGKAVQPLSGDLSSSMSVTVNIAVAREKQFGE